MKIKQILCGALAAFMLVGSCLGASADEIRTEGNHNVLITYGVSDSFVVTIPSDINIGVEGVGTAEIVASNVMIPYKSNLNVSITSNSFVSDVLDGNEHGHFYLTNKKDNSNTLAYDVLIENQHGAQIKGYNDCVALSVASKEAFDGEASSTLNFVILDDITNSGVYTDIMTFVVGIEKELFSFYICPAYENEEILVYAEYGMTWREWINSEYTEPIEEFTGNTEWYVDSDYIGLSAWGDIYQYESWEEFNMNENIERVSPDDVISANASGYGMIF